MPENVTEHQSEYASEKMSGHMSSLYQYVRIYLSEYDMFALCAGAGVSQWLIRIICRHDTRKHDHCQLREGCQRRQFQSARQWNLSEYMSDKKSETICRNMCVCVSEVMSESTLQGTYRNRSQTKCQTIPALFWKGANRCKHSEQFTAVIWYLTQRWGSIARKVWFTFSGNPGFRWPYYFTIIKVTQVLGT